MIGGGQITVGCMPVSGCWLLLFFLLFFHRIMALYSFVSLRSNWNMRNAKYKLYLKLPRECRQNVKGSQPLALPKWLHLVVPKNNREMGGQKTQIMKNIVFV